MKPFDLEQAKAGKSLVTRDGRDAKFIAYVAECDRAYCVLCHVDGDTFVGSYTDDGKRFLDETISCADLFMKTVKKTVYVNIWFGRACLECSSQTHDSLQSATNAARLFEGRNYLAIAVPIEIEE